MFKKAGRNIFFMAVYLSGILIGGIYTPQLISYAKQASAQKTEQQQIQKKPKSKKINAAIRQLV